MKLNNGCFYGQKISEYGLQHGRVDYRAFARSFDGVLNNDIMKLTDGVIGYWEIESGFVDNSEKIEEIENHIENLNDKIIDLNSELDELDADNDGKQIEQIEDTISDLENKVYDLEQKKDELESEQDNIPEVYQWYIIDDNGADICKRFNEIVYYNSELDMYLWGVDHWGTSWDYVLTGIEIENVND